MVAVSDGADTGTIDVHTVPEILVEDPGTLGYDIFVFHVDVIIYGEEMFVVLLHVLHVDEIALGTTDPFDAFEIFHDLSIRVPRETVEETHLEIAPHGIYDFLDFIVEPGVGHDRVILEDHGVLESLFEAPPVKLHVSHVASDGSHVEVGHVGSEMTPIVVHLEGLLEVHGVHDVLVLFGILYALGVRTVDDFQGYRLVVMFEELSSA